MFRQRIQQLLLGLGLGTFLSFTPLPSHANPVMLMPFAEVIFPGFLLTMFGIGSLQGPRYQFAQMSAASLDNLKYKFLAGCSRPENLQTCYDHANNIASWYDQHLSANDQRNLAAHLRKLRQLIHAKVENESITLMSDGTLKDLVALIHMNKMTFFDPDNIGYVPQNTTVEEYFGPLSSPNYFNLANVAYRIISECYLGTMFCEDAKTRGLQLAQLMKDAQ